jgi:asparagine synthetase B (glutamine-hydrolysing)
MCGINLAVALGTTTLGNFGSNAFAAMHYANQLRGVDAAGIFARKGKDVMYWKDAGPASEQHRPSGYTTMLNSARFAVGHTRAATLGSGDDPKAAHPFNPPSVVGVHNGTVRGYKAYFKEATDPINDSDAFYQAIAAVPPEEAVDVLGRVLYGAFALVWYDIRAEELRIARNDERPFWMAEYTTSAGTFLLGASQPSYIAMAVSHASGDPEAYLKVKAYELSVGKMLSISFKTGETTITDFETHDPSSVWATTSTTSRWTGHRGYGSYGAGYESSYHAPYYECTSRYSSWAGRTNQYDVYEDGKKRTVVYDYVTKTWSDKEED